MTLNFVCSTSLSSRGNNTASPAVPVPLTISSRCSKSSKVFTEAVCHAKQVLASLSVLPIQLSLRES